jgi:hypothetical protein
MPASKTSTDWLPESYSIFKERPSWSYENTWKNEAARLNPHSYRTAASFNRLYPEFASLHSGYNLYRYAKIIRNDLKLRECVAEYRFTEYFEKEVLRKRPYLKKEWCIRVVESPLKVEPQEQNRFRFWGIIDELEGHFLRVVTLEDKTTIHNAFPDRGYKP